MVSMFRQRFTLSAPSPAVSLAKTGDQDLQIVTVIHGWLVEVDIHFADYIINVEIFFLEQE